MTQSLYNVIKFVAENTDFQTSIGVIASTKAADTQLAWGAINRDTQEAWVPELEDVQDHWDDAQWTPVTEQQASLFDSNFRSEAQRRRMSL